LTAKLSPAAPRGSGSAFMPKRSCQLMVPAAPAHRAVVADLAGVAVEEDIVELEVLRHRPEVVGAGEEVLERHLLGRPVTAAVILAGDPSDTGVPTSLPATHPGWSASFVTTAVVSEGDGGGWPLSIAVLARPTLLRSPATTQRRHERRDRGGGRTQRRPQQASSSSRWSTRDRRSLRRARGGSS